MSATVYEPCSEYELTHAFDVEITNSPPTILALTGPIEPQWVETEIFIDVVFADPNRLDVHDVSIAWGDGEDSIVPAAASPIAISHTYAEPGLYVVDVELVDDEGAAEQDAIEIEVLDEVAAAEAVGEYLEWIIDSSPGTLVADKVEDVIVNLGVVIAELHKTPPDNQAAIGNLEGAVGDLEAAVKDGLLDEAQGTVVMDFLAEIARRLAEDAVDTAVAAGGDSGDIDDAKAFLAEADGLRGQGKFKDAVAKYKDALSKAEGAI